MLVCGKGLLNKAINSLQFDLHIPGYQFCGPGTKLKERLQKNQRGINPTDVEIMILIILNLKM